MGWTTPRTWVAGELLTAALLNTHLRDNDAAIRAGGIAIASQASLDLITGASSSQFGRVAAGSALQGPRINAAGTAWEFANPAMMLLNATTGSITAANASPGNLMTYAVSGLLSTDMLVVFLISNILNSTGDGGVIGMSPYSVTDSVAFFGLQNVPSYNTNSFYEFRLCASTNSNTIIHSKLNGSIAAGATVTTAWTGSWTFGIHYTSINWTSGAVPWRVLIYKQSCA